MAAATWLDRAKEAPLLEVAAELGLEYRRAGPSLSPCPNPKCGRAERSGSTPDGRGPAGLYPFDRPDHWHCFRCDAGRDGLDLVAYRLTGHRLSEAPAEDLGRVHAWYADRGWCDPEPGYAPRRPPPRPAAPRTVAPAPDQRPRPPAAEYAALWEACPPVTGDAGVTAWLRSRRGIDPAVVVERDLARALPRGVDLPAWARCRGAPWSAGWRCILPAWDARGELATLRARWALPGDPERGVKDASPAGGRASGTVLANRLGRELLRDGKAPDDWARFTGETFTVVVAEGAPDFLTWSTKPAPIRAVFGLWAGAWTADLAARIPAGVRVVVRTHADEAGDKYAKAVIDSLAGRCDVFDLHRKEA